jgi:hypothetical protein
LKICGRNTYRRKLSKTGRSMGLIKQTSDYLPVLKQFVPFKVSGDRAENTGGNLLKF